MSIPSPRTAAAIAAATLSLAAGGATLGYASMIPLVPPPPARSVDTVPSSEVARLDADLEFWERKRAEDPTSALVRRQLAELHAERARTTGRHDDWLAAERLARASLTERRRGNGAASATLVTALLAQHRFADAFAEADSLVRHEPTIAAYRAMLGEVAMELGRYDVARAMFDSAWTAREQPPVAPRLARWLELQGHVSAARRLLTRAATDAFRRGDVSPGTRAWFALRLGELEQRAGRRRAARDAFLSGLAIAPDDVRLHTAMARLAGGCGEWERAIAWGESAIAIRLDPEPLIALAEAHRARGERDKAQEYEEALRLIDSTTDGPPHRSWSLYRVDHRLDVDTVLREAQQALAGRPDIYGYDLVAWALHHAGRHAESKAMMRHALSLGTTDPLLIRHANAIEPAPGK